MPLVTCPCFPSSARTAFGPTCRLPLHRVVDPRPDRPQAVTMSRGPIYAQIIPLAPGGAPALNGSGHGQPPRSPLSPPLTAAAGSSSAPYLGQSAPKGRTASAGAPSSRSFFRPSEVADVTGSSSARINSGRTVYSSNAASASDYRAGSSSTGQGMTGTSPIDVPDMSGLGSYSSRKRYDNGLHP